MKKEFEDAITLKKEKRLQQILQPLVNDTW
jgi:hypothetical protein